MSRNLFADEEECRPQAEVPVKQTQEQETWAADYLVFQNQLEWYEPLTALESEAALACENAMDALAKSKGRLQEQKDRRNALVQSYHEKLAAARAAAAKRWQARWETQFKKAEEAVSDKKNELSETEHTLHTHQGIVEQLNLEFTTQMDDLINSLNEEQRKIYAGLIALVLVSEHAFTEEYCRQMPLLCSLASIPPVYNQAAWSLLEKARQTNDLTRNQKRMLKTPVEKFLQDTCLDIQGVLRTEADFCNTDLYHNLKNPCDPQFHHFDKDSKALLEAECHTIFFKCPAPWTYFNIAERNEKNIHNMIYCYLRHDDICKLLAPGEQMKRIDQIAFAWQKNREKYRQAKQDLDKTETVWKKLKSELEALEKEQTALKDQFKAQSDILQQGTKVLKLLPEDGAALTELRSQIEALDREIASAKEEADSLSQEVRQKKDVITRVQEELAACAQIVDRWMSGDALPPLNGETVWFSGKICMPGSQSKGAGPSPGSARLSVLSHNTNPMVFFYDQDKWLEDGAVELISHIWRGFAKTVPRQLLNISVADPARMVSGRIGSPTRTRLDFVKSYQEGYAGKEGAASGRNRVRGLFEEQDIQALDRELEETQKSIQSYEVEHFAEILDSRTLQAYGDPEGMPAILRVNMFTLENDTPPFLRPYHVVIFVVPDQEPGWAVRPHLNQDQIKYMANLITRGNTADFGFLPIFLMSGQNHSEYWRHLADAMARDGLVFQVDLKKAPLEYGR